MARVPFAPENKVARFEGYPKLSLEKGERARICVMEQPFMEWTHALRKPKLEHGKPVYTSRQNKDGSSTQVLENDFVGQHICLGDESVMAEKSSDPENCPTCKAAMESTAISPAKRRFAAHVLRYKTQPGSFNLQDPFQVELLAWVFADNRYDTLVDLQEEWGDIRTKDLLLGPCEVKSFQKFDIAVAAKCAWLDSGEANKLLAAETFKNNQIKGDAGLVPLIARKVDVAQINADIATVLTAHDIAFGSGAVSESLKEEFGQDISALLDASPDGVVSDPLDAGPAFMQDAAQETADLLTADEDATPDEVATDATVEEAAVSVSQSSTESLDDLLSGL